MGRVVAVLVMLVGVTAWAGGRNPVERLAADAAAAYHAGEFQHAAELLERAYRMQPVSALLYNLAKAYDKLGESDKAVDCYARYASADDADPRLRSKAEQRVASLTPRKEPPRPVERPAPPKPEPEPPRPVVVAPPRPPVVTPPPAPKAPDPKKLAEEEHAREVRRDRSVALGLGVVGVSALGSAIGLSVNALSLHDRFGTTYDETQKRQLKSDALHQAIAADVLYAVGAVSVGVATFFTWRGFRSQPKLSLAPVVSPTLLGWTAEGRF